MGDYPLDQQGDVLLYQSENEGNISLVDVGEDALRRPLGVIQMTTSFDTMAYLVLYGGNVEDPGGDDKSQQWWGNFSEPDTAKHYRGEYQYMIEGVAATSANLRLVEAAAQRDFERAFVDTKIADSVTVTATIPRYNNIELTIEIEAQGERSEYKYTENWESTV